MRATGPWRSPKSTTTTLPTRAPPPLISVPQWARYDLHGSLATLEDGVAHARAAADESLLAGGPVFRVPLVLAWLGRFDEAEARALECMRHRRAHAVPVGAGTAARRAHADSRSPAATSTTPSSTRTARSCCNASPGYHWAAGLFLPPSRARTSARGQFEQAREALATWSETADALEQASVDLFSRWVTACERRLAVLGAPLPGLPLHPMVGGDAWAVLAVELAQREGASGDLRERARPARPRSNGSAAC